jgi:hypothetical protein
MRILPKIIIGFGCTLALTALAPSPARLLLLDNKTVASPKPNLPENPTLISQAKLAEISDRPLFSSGRKKDPPVAINEENTGIYAYRLSAVMTISGSGVAIVEQKKTKETKTLKVGDKLDELIVKAVSKDKVIFNGARGVEILEIPRLGGVIATSEIRQKDRKLQNETRSVAEDND